MCHCFPRKFRQYLPYTLITVELYHESTRKIHTCMDLTTLRDNGRLRPLYHEDTSQVNVCGYFDKETAGCFLDILCVFTIVGGPLPW